jgi:error-prone DNA polymerase
MEGRVVIQWDKDDCADLGIVKVDLLGLGMLAAIERMIPMIREHEGVDVDLAHLPPDDPAVYRMLNEADTVGVFQVESRAQMASLPRNAPLCFYDLVIQVAIIRPGPIVGGMVHPFFDRRQGRAPVTYAHPSLEPILKRTLGVPLFQEQLLRIAMVAAGFTGGEAEELRRAMGFKRSEKRMKAIEGRLRAGMAERGITGEVADTIVLSISSFALYGFPESHAASFALIAYASAFLKRHHPAAFTCALLDNQPMGFYHPFTLVKDAQRHGVRFRPVDVTRSGRRCTLEEGEVRLGLGYVRGLRAEAADRIEAERALRPFASLQEFVDRTGLRRDEQRSLAEVGALRPRLRAERPLAGRRLDSHGAVVQSDREDRWDKDQDGILGARLTGAPRDGIPSSRSGSRATSPGPASPWVRTRCRSFVGSCTSEACYGPPTCPGSPTASGFGWRAGSSAASGRGRRQGSSS